MKDFTYSLDSIDAAAEHILTALTFKVVLFEGSMGAGKTTLIQAFAKAMGSKDVATSPTFSIVNEYLLKDDKLFHFDLYRLESIEEAYDFGIEDYLYSGHWVFIEWPQIIHPLLPEDAVTLKITIENETTRSVSLSKT